MPARECHTCEHLLPQGHHSCPKCESPTTWRPVEPDVTPEEAKSMGRHSEFERYYAKREAAALKRADDRAAKTEANTELLLDRPRRED